MKTRIITAALLLPLSFAILFFFPPYILTATISLIAAIGSYELMKAASDTLRAPLRPVVYTILIAALIPPAIYTGHLIQSIANTIQFTLLLTVFFILLCLLIIDFLLSFKSSRRLKLLQLPVILTAAIIIPYMLSTLIGLRMMPVGHLLVLLPIVVTILTDSGAYFTGVAIGKRKAFPTISPNKTVEGCIGGLIAGAAGLLIYGVILDITTDFSVNYPILIIYGFIGAIVTESGDLVFSYIKRKCDIKDYGNLIPGHGGILDRFDSMIFTAPTIYLLVTLFPAI